MINFSDNKIINANIIEPYRVPPPFSRNVKVLISPETTGNNITILLVSINVGYTNSLHKHDVDEYIYVIRGRGMNTIGEEKREGPNTLIYCERGISHELKNIGEEQLEIFCVFIPPLKPSGELAKAIEFAKLQFRGKKD